MTIFYRPNDGSENNASTILEQSLNNKAPFGIPTVTLRPEQFKDLSKNKGKVLRFSRADMLALIDNQLKDTFNNHSDLSHTQSKTIINKYLSDASEELMTQIVSNIVIPQHIQSGCIPFPFMGINGPFAHEFNKSNYSEPNAALVFTFCNDVDGKSYGESMMSLEEGSLPEMPGSKEEWQFMLLWHEYAHTTGACEPHADKIAAVITKQAFGNNNVINALADQRLVTSILNYTQHINTEYYGLPLVNNLDDVAQTQQTEIDKLTIEQLKNYRFEKYDYQADIIRKIGDILNQSLHDIFETVSSKKRPITLDNLKQIKEETQNAIDNNLFKDDLDAIRIAKRAVLALDRLTQGKKAYEGYSL
jgi:hypothetical protein